jgi:Fe-S-cluster-containing dehydrogenase component/formate-dependent nitrite reductase membrane component NrfD
MPNYGFAIDLRKCIGCHACTIACKAEHQIPVGVNRCWVKTVEKGAFPATRRFFFPVLCNQCDEAPCARICPTRALFRRPDGIVACPYDQLFIDPNTHTAEKCNFCANRVANELLPACVSVCPTECRIFGDLDDPTSAVARIAERESVTVRKPEKGTRPKVLYIAAEESAIQPEAAARPFMFKEGQVRLRPLGAPAPDPLRPADPRVDYDTPHVKPWGVDMAIYLLTKGVATGAMLLSVVAWLLDNDTVVTRLLGPAASLAFLLVTAIVLVVDLERPERFYYILIRPNWRSWMVWGAYFLTAQGALTTVWIAAAWLGWRGVLQALALPLVACSLLTTCYTGFLFAQGLARDLWQGPHAAIDLVAQAIAEGAAVLILIALASGAAPLSLFGWALAWALGFHVVFIAFENLLAPSPTRHHELAVAALKTGAFAPIFWGGAIAIALLTVVAAPFATMSGGAIPLAIVAVLSLCGSFAWEYVWVEAGQSVPLS